MTKPYDEHCPVSVYHAFTLGQCACGMVYPGTIAGICRIPHDAIDAFIARVVATFDLDNHSGCCSPPSVIDYLDDAITNLRQLRAEYDEQARHSERLRVEIERVEALWKLDHDAAMLLIAELRQRLVAKEPNDG